MGILPLTVHPMLPESELPEVECMLLRLLRYTSNLPLREHMTIFLHPCQYSFFFFFGQVSLKFSSLKNCNSLIISEIEYADDFVYFLL